VLLASETGSGKTLAYLLPLVARLRAEEAAAGGVREARPGRPRALVLSPGGGLARRHAPEPLAARGSSGGHARARP